MLQSRDASLTKSSHRSVAQLLESHKLDSARIRVESIIRSDILTELHEILELYCELLLARFPLLDASGSPGGNSRKNSSGNGGTGGEVVCDPGLEEAVKSIIYAAPRTEIKELGVLRVLLGEKFGKDFVASAAEGAAGGVSDKVVRRLGVEPPKPELVEGYLEEIAAAYGVEWAGAPKERGEDVLDLLIDTEEGAGEGDEGGQALKELEALAPGEAPASTSTSTSPPPRPAASSPPAKTAPASTPPPKTPAGGADTTLQKPPPRAQEPKPAKPSPPASGVPDLSELEARFAALKKLG